MCSLVLCSTPGCYLIYEYFYSDGLRTVCNYTVITKLLLTRFYQFSSMIDLILSLLFVKIGLNWGEWFVRCGCQIWKWRWSVSPLLLQTLSVITEILVISHCKYLMLQKNKKLCNFLYNLLNIATMKGNDRVAKRIISGNQLNKHLGWASLKTV